MNGTITVGGTLAEFDRSPRNKFMKTQKKNCWFDLQGKLSLLSILGNATRFYSNLNNDISEPANLEESKINIVEKMLLLLLNAACYRNSANTLTCNYGDN